MKTKWKTSWLRFWKWRRLARGKQTKETIRIAFNEQERGRGREKHAHTPTVPAAFLCASWLSSHHTCHRTAQGPAVCARPAWRGSHGPVSMQMVSSDKSRSCRDADGGWRPLQPRDSGALFPRNSTTSRRENDFCSAQSRVKNHALGLFVVS